VRGLKRGDCENLLELFDQGFVEVLQANVAARPRLMLDQRLAARIEGPQAGDAHGRRLESLANGCQQHLGHGRESVHGAATGAKKEQLDCHRDLAIGAEALSDGRDVVLAQRKALLDVELRQPGGKVLCAYETLCKGHDGTLRAVQTANLPGSGASANPRALERQPR
jgi:hypothetical protein